MRSISPWSRNFLVRAIPFCRAQPYCTQKNGSETQWMAGAADNGAANDRAHGTERAPARRVSGPGRALGQALATAAPGRAIAGSGPKSNTIPDFG